MSITRQLLHEFRPFFRLLDEPFGHSPSLHPALTKSTRHHQRNHIFAEPYGSLNILACPAVDVVEQGNRYILDADLPGMSRENIQVRLGDGNQSITIEGRMIEKSSAGVRDAGAESKLDPNTVSSAEYTDASHSTSATTNSGDATQIAAERPYSRNYSFTRTIWLPRPVNPDNVTAKLHNGVLSVSLPKAAHDESKVIGVDEA